ncbi:MAG: transcriptional regulator [Clostridiales bacterium]|nr:transcriptional regulator [Clostridiales bacterium]
MKLIIAIVNNDDSVKVISALTKEGFFSTKLSTTGGFLLAGNTTLLIGAEDDKVQRIKEIISGHSATREKNLPTSAALGRGLSPTDVNLKAKVKGATVFVLDVDSFEKL